MIVVLSIQDLGETQQFLKTHLQEHCRSSSMTSEASQHVNKDRPGHTMSLDSVNIVNVENKKFERDVKEAIHI